ncbi:hypothetical protein U1Q18_027852 [Sarracenia purpurea var. burkii]
MAKTGGNSDRSKKKLSYSLGWSGLEKAKDEEDEEQNEGLPGLPCFILGSPNNFLSPYTCTVVPMRIWCSCGTPLEKIRASFLTFEG